MNQKECGMKKAVLILGLGIVAIGTIAASPYKAFTDRPVKAMSAERIDALRTGKGAGYALAAELNGYPGPRHVIDLADGLGLTAEQTAAAQKLFDEMQTEAVPLGTALIEAETALESLFRSGRVTETLLVRQTAEIGALDARLRATHLKYHLAMKDALSRHQIALYDRLRGYGGHGDGGHGDGGRGTGGGHQHRH
jgi:Spy/CpxP family protein refolding chaperone